MERLIGKFRYFALVTIGFAVCVGVSGCVTGGTSRTDGPLERPRNLKIIEFKESSTLPFDSYTLTQPQLVRFQTEEAKILTNCAAKAGVSIVMAGDYLKPKDTSHLFWYGRIGTLSLRHAAQWGYRAAPDESYSLSAGFYIKDVGNLQINQSDPDRVLSDVLYGPPKVGSDGKSQSPTPRGCLPELQRQVGVPLLSLTGPESDLRNLAYDDSRTQAAMAKWADCMTQANQVGLKHPQEAPAQSVTSELDSVEISVATSDVRCTKQSRWADIYYALLTAYEREWLQQHFQDAQSVLSSQKRWLKALDRRS